MDNFWVVDGHCDSLGDYLEGKRSLRDSSQGGHWDLERARKGKIGLQILAAYIESQYKPTQATWRGLELIHAAHRFVRENSSEVSMIREKKDLLALPDSDRLGVLLSVEGGEILGESLFMLDLIYELGVRALGLTWNQRNAIADGAGEKTNSRLTRFGEEVVRRMNGLGMLIDVSHLNEAGFWHVLELSDQPITASHSCAYSLCPHPRNLTDDQLRAIAQVKGVVGVNFYPAFLTPDSQAQCADVIRHICHIVEVAGIDTVGLGSDFDGISCTPTGLDHVEDVPKIATALRDIGFSVTDVEKIMYKNFMRLLLDVIK